MRMDSSASLSATLPPTAPVLLNAEPSMKVQEVKQASEAQKTRAGGASAQSHAAPGPQHGGEPDKESRGRLRIEWDRAAGVYVQRLIDPTTEEVLRQFPHDSQLMLSRAQRAYQTAVIHHQRELLRR